MFHTRQIISVLQRNWASGMEIVILATEDNAKNQKEKGKTFHTTQMVPALEGNWGKGA